MTFIAVKDLGIIKPKTRELVAQCLGEPRFLILRLLMHSYLSKSNISDILGDKFKSHID